MNKTKIFNRSRNLPMTSLWNSTSILWSNSHKIKSAVTLSKGRRKKLYEKVDFKDCNSSRSFWKRSWFFQISRFFPKYLKFHFRCFAILEIYFLVKFRPYMSVFDKVTALLILWEFDHRIDGEFHNDIIGRSRDLLKILALLKKKRKIHF